MWKLENCSSEGRRPERSSEFYCQKNKNDQKKTVRRRRLVPILYLSNYFTFLSKFLTFLSLFQPLKTFPHVFHYPNLSKKTFWENFFRTKIFFPKKIIHFFFFDFFFFSIFFFLNFFSRFFLFEFFFEFFFCLNSTASFCILLTKQTKTL